MGAPDRAGREDEVSDEPATHGTGAAVPSAGAPSDDERPYTHPEVLREKTVIEIDAFSVFYQTAPALVDITMNVPVAQVTSLIGPSGCGKSTLLRSLNRMNDLVEGVRIEGDVRLHGEALYGRGVSGE